MIKKKRRTRGISGMTLMEIMVVTGLLVVVIGAVTTCLIRGLNHYFHTTDLSFSLRSNYTGIEQMTRELRLAKKFYHQDYDVSILDTFDGKFGPNSTITQYSLMTQLKPLVFGTSDGKYIGYRLDKNEELVKRIIYNEVPFNSSSNPADWTWEVKKEGGKDLIKDIAILSPKEKFDYDDLKFEFRVTDASINVDIRKNLLTISIVLSRALSGSQKVTFPIETEIKMRR